MKREKDGKKNNKECEEGVNMERSDNEDYGESLMWREVVSDWQKAKLIPQIQIQPIEAHMYGRMRP